MKNEDKTKEQLISELVELRQRTAELETLEAERKRGEEALRSALEESRQRQAEISALLEGSRAVLEYREFMDAARAIFDSCKKLIGATAGYVALLTEDGTEYEVLFLESGDLPCTVDPALPMPIRGLREEAYRTGKTVYHNDFSNSEWVRFIPEGHASLDNVLFAPLVLEGKAVGLLGLANKPGGFTENDARMASASGEFAAIALLNSRTLESLENSEERFRSVMQTASDAIISIDSRGNVVFWNDAAENIFGYSADEAVGKPLTLIMPERFREAHQKGIQRVVSTGKSNIIGKTVELAGLIKDGSEFPLELSLAAWKTREGIFFTAIVRDITERKRAEEELERYAAELKRSNQDLEQFAYVASHDLQEPLRMVISYMHLLEQRYGAQLDATADEFIGYAVDGATRMQELIKDLLAYARVSTRGKDFVPTDCQAIFGRTLANLEVAIEESDAVVTHAPLPTVMADDVQLGQLFQNLIGNAVKFRSEEPPRIHVSAEQNGNTWVFSVRDNGIGIDPQYAERIFEVFQRLHTREEYPGTGIGLAVCKKIVERHGGRIWVESQSGEGATFCFTIPGER